MIQRMSLCGKSITKKGHSFVVTSLVLYEEDIVQNDEKYISTTEICDRTIMK